MGGGRGEGGERGGTEREGDEWRMSGGREGGKVFV